MVTEVTVAPPRQPDSAEPSTATELPHTLTGALIGALITLPPRIEPLPLLRWEVVEAPPPVTVAPPRQPASASPRTAIALPQTLIGALIGALTALPPRIELLPDVRWTVEPPAPPAPPALVTAAPPAQAASDWPSRATALPHRLIGRLIGALTALPPGDRVVAGGPLGRPRPTCAAHAAHAVAGSGRRS